MPQAANHHRPSGLWWSAVVLLVFSAILGGGTKPGFPGDVVVQLIAVPVLLLAFLAMAEERDVRVFTPLVVGFLLVLALTFLLQLVPLPPGLTTTATTYQRAESGLALVGSHDAWRPLTISGKTSSAVMLAAIPPFAMFLAVSQLGPVDRRRLVTVILSIGVVSLLLGVLQVMQGPTSPLRFFAITNPEEAVGFFANRNHLAALLVVVLALTSAWLVWSVQSLLHRRMARRMDGFAWGAVLIPVVLLFALFLGVALTRSRAGMGLAAFALMSVLIPALLSRSRTPNAEEGPLRKILALVISAAFATAVIVGFGRFASRFSIDTTRDLRWPFSTTTFEQIIANFPFGTGFGSFVDVYAMAEKTEHMRHVFANRAHNDLLEFLLEANLLGLILLTLVLIWYGRHVVTIWFDRAWAADRSYPLLIARAASLAVLALLLHSLVDYPLRTTALATLFAALLGLMVLPREPLVWADAEPAPAAKGGMKGQSPPRKPRRPRMAPVTSPTPTPSGPQTPRNWPDAWNTSKPKEPGS